ncbi:MAG: exosome complex RNA-binding protein Csl4 [Candidatus Diapherotrites archaeon]|nr:exosome complex RNA-binding protein Csl4 [Candidatus Diapherotrites archaeon]
MSAKKDSNIVMPGDFLSTEEEFTPGLNAFSNDEGRVLSDSVGIPSFNIQKHEVDVDKKSRTVKVAGIGNVVFGRIMLVKDNMVVLELFGSECNGEPRRLLQSSGTIMVSRVSNNYVKRLDDEFRIGDLVKAKIVESNSYGIELTTSEPNLGVIRAFCITCRQELGMFSGKLKCTNCGSQEQRKTATDYSLKMD